MQHVKNGKINNRMLNFGLKNSELSFFSYKIALSIVYVSSQCLSTRNFMSDFSFVYCSFLFQNFFCLFVDDFM